MRSAGPRRLQGSGDRSLRITLAGLLSFHPEFSVVGQAEDGYDAVLKVEELRPDVVIMDISMPRMNGIEATRLIVSALPDVKSDRALDARRGWHGADDASCRSGGLHTKVRLSRRACCSSPGGSGRLDAAADHPRSKASMASAKTTPVHFSPVLRSSQSSFETSCPIGCSASPW